MNKFSRLLFIIDLLPSTKNKGFSISDIQERFELQGYYLNRRSIERDLIDLQEEQLVVCLHTEGRKKFFNRSSSNSLSLPKELAFVLNSLHDQIEKNFPSEVYESLSEYFDAADETVNKTKRSKPYDKLLMFTKSIERSETETKLDILKCVNDSIYLDNELRVSIDDSDEERIFKPKEITNSSNGKLIHGFFLDNDDHFESVPLSKFTAAECVEFSHFNKEKVLSLNINR